MHVRRASAGTTTALILSISLCVILVVGSAGCGPAGRPPDESLDPGASTTVVTGPAEPVAALFIGLAQAVAPMPVYGLEELPAGVSVARHWWPVITLDHPSDYHGDVRANPLITGVNTGDPQIQLLLESGQGWMVIVEDFRGDVGDVQGEVVGRIEESQARLYEVNGGVLVQWSVDGRWYGVFGRGVPEALVVDIALAMRRVYPA